MPLITSPVALRGSGLAEREAEMLMVERVRSALRPESSESVPAMGEIGISPARVTVMFCPPLLLRLLQLKAPDGGCEPHTTTRGMLVVVRISRAISGTCLLAIPSA